MMMAVGLKLHSPIGFLLFIGISLVVGEGPHACETLINRDYIDNFEFNMEEETTALKVSQCVNCKRGKVLPPELQALVGKVLPRDLPETEGEAPKFEYCVEKTGDWLVPYITISGQEYAAARVPPQRLGELIGDRYVLIREQLPSDTTLLRLYVRQNYAEALILATVPFRTFNNARVFAIRLFDGETAIKWLPSHQGVPRCGATCDERTRTTGAYSFIGHFAIDLKHGTATLETSGLTAAGSDLKEDYVGQALPFECCSSHYLLPTIHEPDNLVYTNIDINVMVNGKCIEVAGHHANREQAQSQIANTLQLKVGEYIENQYYVKAIRSSSEGYLTLELGSWRNRGKKTGTVPFHVYYDRAFFQVSELKVADEDGEEDTPFKGYKRIYWIPLPSIAQ